MAVFVTLRSDLSGPDLRSLHSVTSFIRKMFDDTPIKPFLTCFVLQAAMSASRSGFPSFHGTKILLTNSKSMTK